MYIFNCEIGISDDGVRLVVVFGGLLYLGCFVFELVFGLIGLDIDWVCDVGVFEIIEKFFDWIVVFDCFVRFEDVCLYGVGKLG